MEVAVPLLQPPKPPSPDFNFDSTCSSPYMTAPSSPQRFGNFFFTSAPTSPTKSIITSYSNYYNDHHEFHARTNSESATPFQWEEKPGNFKSSRSQGGDGDGDGDGDDNFEFFSGHLDRVSNLSDADELFHGGKIKIKPLKPPPSMSFVGSSTSPRSPRIIGNNPFQAAIVVTRKQDQNQREQFRGRRQRSVRKVSRSLSPMRVSDMLFDQEQNVVLGSQTTNSTSTTPISTSNYVSNFLSAISFSKGNYKKWKLKDLLLFRSASEGRASSHNKSPLFSDNKKDNNSATEDSKAASFRSTESVGSSRRRLRGGPPVSARKVHYPVNRAISEDLRRKTFLPYKQGLLGCLGFNPGVREISKGIGSFTRQ